MFSRTLIESRAGGCRRSSGGRRHNASRATKRRDAPTEVVMIEVTLAGGDRTDWALTALNGKVGLMQQSINSTAIGGARGWV